MSANLGSTISVWIIGSIACIFVFRSLFTIENRPSKVYIKRSTAKRLGRGKRVLVRGSQSDASKTDQSVGLLLSHLGTCHCGGIKFLIEAPSVVECYLPTSGQIRYPSYKLPLSKFRLLCGGELLSHYSVLFEDSLEVFTYGFCSQCGIHVLNCLNPSESHAFGASLALKNEAEETFVCVNMDCVKDTQFEEIQIMEVKGNPSVPLPSFPSQHQAGGTLIEDHPHPSSAPPSPSRSPSHSPSHFRFSEFDADTTSTSSPNLFSPSRTSQFTNSFQREDFLDKPSLYRGSSHNEVFESIKTPPRSFNSYQMDYDYQSSANGYYAQMSQEPSNYSTDYYSDNPSVPDRSSPSQEGFSSVKPRERMDQIRYYMRKHIRSDSSGNGRFSGEGGNTKEVRQEC